MNDTFKELKARTRRLDELLTERGLGNVAFAQALSQVHRLMRRSDRSREPSPELEDLLRRAETLGRSAA
jgi:hypothetical protein